MTNTVVLDVGEADTGSDADDADDRRPAAVPAAAAPAPAPAPALTPNPNPPSEYIALTADDAVDLFDRARDRARGCCWGRIVSPRESTNGRRVICRRCHWERGGWCFVGYGLAMLAYLLWHLAWNLQTIHARERLCGSQPAPFIPVTMDGIVGGFAWCLPFSLIRHRSPIAGKRRPRWIDYLPFCIFVSTFMLALAAHTIWFAMAVPPSPAECVPEYYNSTTLAVYLGGGTAMISVSITVGLWWCATEILQLG